MLFKALVDKKKEKRKNKINATKLHEAVRPLLITIFNLSVILIIP